MNKLFKDLVYKKIRVISIFAYHVSSVEFFISGFSNADEVKSQKKLFSVIHKICYCLKLTDIIRPIQFPRGPLRRSMQGGIPVNFNNGAPIKLS